MDFIRIVKTISLSTLILLMTAGMTAAEETKEIIKEFKVSPGGELMLETDLGSVEVTSGSNDAVEISVFLEARTRDKDRAERMIEDFQIEFDQQGDNIEVVAEYDRQSSWNFWGSKKDQLKVEFEIKVPEEYDLLIETRGGSIAIGSLNGDIRVTTSGGSLYFENIKGPIRGRTSGGSIELASCTGTVDVKTSGGSISIGHVSGDVDAHTSGGSISVEEALGSINASTSGGSIKARLTRQPLDNCRLTTSGGNVTVYASPELAVELDAKTSSGRVKIDFPVSLDGRITDSAIRGSLNGGGPELYLRTSGGSINIREL